MNQKDLIKWGLILAGVYLVYRYVEQHGGLAAVLGTGAPALPPPPPQQPAVTGAGSGSSTTGSGTGTQTQQTPPATTPPPAGPDIRQQVLTAAVNALPGSGGAPMLTTDQWSFYFAQTTGQTPPAGIWPNVNPTDFVSIDTWWGPMQQWLAGNSGGVSGFDPFGGWGSASPWSM